jgi:rsbT antagonist protein RsbS
MKSAHRSIPIIKLYKTLVVSIQVEVTDHLVVELKEDIAAAIRQQDVRGLIIEVSGVDVFDSYIARSIRDIALISSLMGVDTILAGVDAGMAITLVEMGMMLDNVRTALNLETALELFGSEVVKGRSEEDWVLDMLINGESDGAHGDDG